MIYITENFNLIWQIIRALLKDFSVPFIDDSYKNPGLKPGLLSDDQESTELKSRTAGSLGEYEQAKAKQEHPSYNLDSSKVNK